MSEFQLHCAIADYLRANLPEDVIWWHMANERRTTPKAGAQLKRLGVRLGVPDLAVLIQDKALFIEVKPEGKYLSKEQKAFHLKANQLGHMTVTCRSLEDVQETLTTVGVKLRARV